MKIKPLHTYAIITVQRPLLWLLSFTVIVCILLILLKISFEYGRNTAGYDSANAETYINQLQTKLEESRAENIESKRQATMLNRNSRIDDDAAVQLKETLAAAEEDVLALKKELSFYKSIVAPEQVGRSLALQKVQLKKNDDGDYQYKVMVSQRGRNDKFARGTVNISIKGMSKGKPLILSLADVSKNVKKSIKFGFKYFQNFEGVMKLPVTFQPDSLHIIVKPSTGKIKTLDEQYVWSKLTTGGV